MAVNTVWGNAEATGAENSFGWCMRVENHGYVDNVLLQFF